MKIDGSPIAKKALEIGRSGDVQKEFEMEKEWTDAILASGEDHCPCTAKCGHHGNCFVCVQIHRGHRDHLPMCMWDMLNERIAGVANLTEGTFLQYAACPKDDAE